MIDTEQAGHCAKACRLRWVGHLRSGIRKDPFSDEEAALVFNLHAPLGNKWVSFFPYSNRKKWSGVGTIQS
jgi:hypothetical protein